MLGPIAYFHHVPFPPPDVVRVLPWYGEVLRGLLGADQLGFHTEGYVQNFLATCALLPDARVDRQRSTVGFQGRDVRVGAFPIGVDVRGLEDRARLESVGREAAAIREGLRVDKLLLSVDRLDYTKGIPERFEAIDQFFTIHPQLKGAVSLLQIAVPSRAEVSEYRELKRGVDELVGRINGKHAQHGWQPIHCTYRSFSLNSLVAHYLAADVALVTPIRDGMNLVAKEFCASRVDGDGVLILSEFAGAAERLGAASLLVNPYDVTAYVHAIGRALTMEPDERRQRMASLRESVGSSDVEDWVNDVVAHATSMP
jgi:trehalose-6-phosphate synthase